MKESIYLSLLQPLLNLLAPAFMLALMGQAAGLHLTEFWDLFALANEKRFLSDFLIVSVPIALIAAISPGLYAIYFGDEIQDQRIFLSLVTFAAFFLLALAFFNFQYWKDVKQGGYLDEVSLMEAKFIFWLSLFIAFLLEWCLTLKERLRAERQKTDNLDNSS